MNEMISAGLAALECRVHKDLEVLEWPSDSWVVPKFGAGQRVRDVVVVGGGMAGLAASAALKRMGILNHLVVDRAPAGREGPWVTFARMRTLRSPKTLAGPALGVPSLTFRAYHDARFGDDAWAGLGKIPRDLWMDYLVWYRRVLALPVQNETVLAHVAVGPDDTFKLTLTFNGEEVIEYARHLVLATGRDGLGGPFVPDVLKSIDRSFWAHTAHEIDFNALKGKRVGVIGAGASSMDNAATALEAGAGRVDLFIRRTDIPRINKLAGINSAGIANGFIDLPNEWKWRFLDYAIKEQTPPPRDSTLRVSQHKEAFFHLGSPVLTVEQQADGLIVTTPKGQYELDFLISGTGFYADIRSRPELSAFADHIKLWSDGEIPSGAAPNAELANSPYLGNSFNFQERVAGSCPLLDQIHCFNFPSTLSHGKLTGDIPFISDGAIRLAQGIAKRLFVADRAEHFQSLVNFKDLEILGDEWRDADAPSPAAR